MTDRPDFDGPVGEPRPMKNATTLSASLDELAALIDALWVVGAERPEARPALIRAATYLAKHRPAE